jgi:hypothetical protein
MSHSLSGLMKWSERPEWDEQRDKLMFLHFSEVMEKHDLTLDKVLGLIGNDGQAVLHGCMLESMAASAKEGRNLAEDYLKRRGWKESAGSRAYIEALRQSVMSVYEISDIVAGESFLARDLIRGGKPVRVFERLGSQKLKPWDKLAARIVTVLGKTQMTGGCLVLNDALAKHAVASVRKLIRAAVDVVIDAEDDKVSKAERRQLLKEATVHDDLLRDCAFVFASIWLDYHVERSLNPVLPKLQNTEGEPMMFVTVRYSLLALADKTAIAASLDGVPALKRASVSVWNWIGQVVPKATGKNSGATKIQTTMADGSTVLGTIELDERAVVLSVNSDGRAVRGQAMLGTVLQRFARTPEIDRKTPEELMAARDKRGAKPKDAASDIPAEEQKAMLSAYLTNHYRTQLDEQIPMLGNKSPRELSKTPKGRNAVVKWLKFIENGTAKEDAAAGVGDYDFTWIWQELGLLDKRV